MRCPSNITGPGDETGGTKADRLAALRRTVQGLQSTPVWMGLTDDTGRAGASLGRGLAHGLPEAGIPSGVLNEAVASPAHKAASLGFLFTLAAAALRQRKGLALFIASRRALDYGVSYGHGLNRLGLDVGRFLLVDAETDKDALWAIEEALRSDARPAMVVGTIEGGLDLTQGRRLNLAAAVHATPLVLLRGAKTSAASAAVTRWRVAPAPAAHDQFGAFGSSRWHVTLERARNGRTGAWVIEWDASNRRFRSVPDTSDPSSFDVAAGT